MDQTRIGLGSGLGANVAADEQPNCQLTKFNSLPPQSAHLTFHLNHNHLTDEDRLCNQLDHPQSLSASNLLAATAEGRQKAGKAYSRLWPAAPQSRQDEPPEALEGRLPQLDQMGPFQVVWSDLSFEVEHSLYDKLLNSALGRLRTAWTPSNRIQQAAVMTQAGREAAGEIADLKGWRNRRLIFERLSGYISSGEVSAILGPSGAGKTSLLNALCGRQADYRGSIRLLGGGQRRMRLSVIPQKDYLNEKLTVRENLLYSSRILNAEPDFNHEANIKRVVEMLNLAHCLHSRAGLISGGEHKRVSIAQELLKQPDILVLDEPTSGLDSLNCKRLIRSLAQLIEASRRGTIRPIAIVVTIHQPDVDVFNMFDHVYCMARGGRVIFDGRPEDCMATLRRQLPELLQADALAGSNPANLLIELASGDLHGQEPIERLARVQRKQFAALYATSGLSTSSGHEANVGGSSSNNNDSKKPPAKAMFEKERPPVSCHPNESSFVCSTASLTLAGSETDRKWAPMAAHLVRDKRLNATKDHSGRFWYHTNLLARRSFVSTLRDPLMTMVSLTFHLSIPFVMWAVYTAKIGTVRACPAIQRDLDMVSMASNRTAERIEELQEELTFAFECSTMFFLTTYSFSMCSLSVAALAFPLNMHILLKEVRNGWYNLPAYVLAKTLASFPFEVLFPGVSLAMICLLLGMPPSYMNWRVCAIALVMALVSAISHTLGLIFGALCMDSVQTAIFLASSSTLPQTLLSGFTARVKYLPAVLQKLSWLSQYRYSSDLTNMIRFGFGLCPCNEATDEYLRTKEPAFADLPRNLKPIFTYYLTSQSSEFEGNSTSGNTTSSNSTTTMDGALGTPGVAHDLVLSASERTVMLAKFESNELDLFGRMADLTSRSFTYGRKIDNCTSVRSQLLATTGTPSDEQLPFMFGCMTMLLLVGKLILFLVVKFKIGSRV